MYYMVIIATMNAWGIGAPVSVSVDHIPFESYRDCVEAKKTLIEVKDSDYDINITCVNKGEKK